MSSESANEGPKTILEIGPQSFPVFEWNPALKSKIEAGSTFIAIDFDESSMEKFLKSSELDNALPIIGDVANLPLPDSSVDQVWLMNVLSFLYNEPNRQSQIVSETDLLNKIFSELSRVTKPGGEVIIGEFYSRYEGSFSNLPKIDFASFNFEASVYRSKEEIVDFALEHDIPERKIIPFVELKNNNKFLLVLKKKSS